MDAERAKFAEIVARSVATGAGGGDPSPGSTAHRRQLLLDYRKKTEEARQQQEQKLAKLVEAQARIDAELAALAQREAAEREASSVDEERSIAQARAKLDEERKQREAERARIAAEEKALEEARRALESKPEPVSTPETLELRRRQVEAIQQHYVQSNAVKPVAAAGAAPTAVRRAPRFEIHAVVRFGQAPDDVLMRARNISMTGALLATEPTLISQFPVGSEHDAAVFVSADPKEVVLLRARVVRHDANAIVIDWASDVECTFRIALLISMLPADAVS